MIRWVFLFFTIYNCNALIAQSNSRIESLDVNIYINELVKEFQNVDSQNTSVFENFSQDELLTLRKYFNTKNKNENKPIKKLGSTLAYGALDIPSQESFVSFDLSSIDILDVISIPEIVIGIEFCGAIYDSENNIGYAFGSEGNFYEIDVSTGIYTHLGIIPLPLGSSNWGGMEFDSSSGLLYGVSPAGSDHVISIIDPLTLTTTELPNTIGFTSNEVIVALAIDAAGTIYIHEIVNDNIWTVDKTTGIGTLLGSTGFNANFAQGMSYDPNTDTIYLASFNFDNGNAEFRSLDTSSGATTFLGNIGETNPGGYIQLTWISFYKNRPLSVESLSEINTLSFYPNPVKNFINIESQKLINTANIYTIRGQNVFSKEINKTQATLDLSMLSKGIYIIQINNDENIENYKIFKE